jgi:hypothetical protein
VEDEDDPEKVAETNYDHWYDGAGYGLIAWHSRQSKKPKGEEGEIAAHKNRLAKKQVHERVRRMLG